MSEPAIEPLPNDPEALKALLVEQEQLLKRQDRLIAQLQAEVAKLEEERRLDRARRFAASSEAGDHQYRLFDEAETRAQDAAEVPSEDPGATVEVAAHTKRRPKRRPLPADLPRVVIRHELPEAEQCCGCGCRMTVIGEKVTEQLDVIPAEVFILEHHRPTYSCPRCDESIKTTPLPPQPIPKSLASPGLLAHVAVAKYADGLPLYRQCQQFERLGIDLSRNTLASHMVKAGALIEPVIEALARHIRSYDIVQMDETPIQVLKEPGKVAQSKSYMWVMKGGPPEHPAIVYHYDPTRAQAVPKRLLPAYEGYLQTDGYAGYNGILAESDIIGVGCWAHVRRKFMDAKKALPKADQTKGNRVQQALSFIGKLYQLEQALNTVDADTRKVRRQSEALPILEKFKTWLTRQSVPPATYLGKAIGYTLAQWPRLLTYLEDGRLCIDNNPVENAIRPFALGRRNWLFSDSQGGADASARLYSLIETAKANRLNDYAYLKWVFTQLPIATTDRDVQRLLPWNVNADNLDAQLKPPR